MTNKFTLKLLSFVLLIVVLGSTLFGCIDYPEYDYSGTSSTTIGGLGTTTRPSTSTSTTPAGTTTGKPDSTTTTTTVIRPGSTTTTGGGSLPVGDHADVDNNGLCDDCGIDVVETIDFYNINDLHGKFENTDDNTGVDELTTYL